MLFSTFFFYWFRNSEKIVNETTDEHSLFFYLLSQLKTNLFRKKIRQVSRNPLKQKVRGSWRYTGYFHNNKWKSSISLISFSFNKSGLVYFLAVLSVFIQVQKTEGHKKVMLYGENEDNIMYTNFVDKRDLLYLNRRQFLKYVNFHDISRHNML